MNYAAPRSGIPGGPRRRVSYGWPHPLVWSVSCGSWPVALASCFGEVAVCVLGSGPVVALVVVAEVHCCCVGDWPLALWAGEGFAIAHALEVVAAEPVVIGAVAAGLASASDLVVGAGVLGAAPGLGELRASRLGADPPCGHASSVVCPVVCFR